MATLTVDLDDNVSDGLDAINEALANTAAQSEEAAKSADELTKAQERQITIINNNKAGWSEFGSTTVTVFGDVAEAGIHCFESIENAPFRLAEIAVQSTASVAKWALGSAVAITGINAAFGNHSKEMEKHKRTMDEADEAHGRFLRRMGMVSLGSAAAGAAAADSVTGYNLMGKAAEMAGKQMFSAYTGLGPQVLAATIAVKGYEAILARTGLTTIELADGTTRVESNLDRVHQATGKLGGDMAGIFTEGMDAAKALYNELDLLPDVWAAIDPIATASANTLIGGIEGVNSGFNEAVLTIRSFADELQGGLAGAYRQEVDLMKQQSDWLAKIEAQREREMESFSRLRAANEQLEKTEAARAEAERINSITKVADIKNEILALQEASSRAAMNGKLDEAAQKSYIATVEALKARERAIIKETEAARQQAIKETQAAHEAFAQAQEKEIAAFLKRHQIVFEAEQKRAEQLAKMNSDLMAAGNMEQVSTQAAASKEIHNAEKDLHSERLKAQGVDEAEIKRQLRDMDFQFTNAAHAERVKQIEEEAQAKRKAIEESWKAAEKSNLAQFEKDKELIRLKGEADKVLFDHQKKMIQENGQLARDQQRLAIDQWRQGEAEKAAAVKAQIDAAKAQAEKSLAGFDTRKLMNNSDPQQVMKQLQADRAAKAQVEQSERDRDLWEQGQAGNKSAANKYAANQKAAMARARRGAREDFEIGNVGDGELAQAQGNVAKQTIQGMQKQGKLTQDQTKILVDAMQAIADQQTAIDQQSQLLGELTAAMKGIKQGAKNGAANARNQQGSLN